MIEARVICDSIGPHSPRLTTFLARYPLPGWVQHRKTLPGEAVAPLPEGYAP